MNTTWLKLPLKRRIEILDQAAAVTGLPAAALEKDWWVSLCLKAAFSSPYSAHIVFKGGTSLSKGWGLIERFSEDIDLAIDRKFFGFEGDISKTQIRKLRKHSCEFISTVFLKDLAQTLADWEAIAHCELFAQPAAASDKDPQVIEVRYHSTLEAPDYWPQRVLIEMGSRSLMEPAEKREVNSILSATFPRLDFATDAFSIPAVLPERTFLEKIFLLHEEFSQEGGKIRVSRLSRHLYDLDRLMDTKHGITALQNRKLYNSVVAHRAKFNALKGLDYANHSPKKIRIVPPDTVRIEYERDYSEMNKFMIFGESTSFENLMRRIADLQIRINSLN